MLNAENEYINTASFEQLMKLEKELHIIDNNHDKAAILLELGLIESFRKNYDKSIKYIEDAQKIFNEIKNIKKIAICLAELALIHYKNCNDRLIRSLTLLNDAKYLLENSELDNKQEVEAQILHYYGIIYYFEKRYSDALKYFKLAQSLLDKNSIEYAKTFDSLAVFYLRTNSYYTAVECMKQSLAIKKEINNPREISITELLLGRYFSNIENYEEAKEHLFKGLETVENLGDFHTGARIWGELAKVYIETDDFKNAEKYAFKSIELAEILDLNLVSAFSKCILANIAIKNKDIEKATEILETEVEQVFKNSSAPRGQGFAKQIRALIYEHSGQVKQAIDCLHEAIELFNEADSSSEKAKSYYKLGVIYKNSSDFPKASASLTEALSIAKTNNLYILGKKIEDLLFEVDEEEWSNIIDKTVKKEDLFSDGKLFLENISLFGELSSRAAGNKDPFLALLRIGRSIAAETDIDKLLSIIAQETQKALSSDRCTVFLYDRDNNELWSKVALGMGSQEIRFPANMGLAGHVATTGETINIKDAYNDSRFNKEIDKKTGYKTKTILCMPMRNLNHEIVGVFQVLNKFGNEHFSAEDEDLLIAIGSSTGIALENARLFKKQQKMYEEQKRSFVSFINTLATSIDARDKITAGHSKRVTMYSIAIAEILGIEGDHLEALEHAALLHDIGKIGIKDSVLCKQGKLTEEEYKHIQEHATITYDILNKMYFEEKFKDVPEIAASHHEKINGAGYFRQLKGEEICIGGRILAVSDVFDAITSKRHYRERMPFINVLNILKKDTGSHFDQNATDAFFSLNLFKILSILLHREDYEINEEMKALFEKYSLNAFHSILLNEESNLSEEEKKVAIFFEILYNPEQKELLK
ncbi:MAG TPA: tetratricopeptide repeat protein [Candidatus Gastranaerophilales bacterium]|nr:tetratricopeptide repeat protein [Candidatus Gastranaerophilales bacterium]